MSLSIEVGKYSKRSFVSLTITYKDQPEINLDAGGYRTAHIMQDDGTLFKECNDYIAKLSDKDQAKLYNCYARVESLLDDYNSDFSVTDIEADDIESILKGIVKDIYDVILFDDLVSYVELNRNLKIPPELRDDYETDDKITPLYMARTYRLQEYKDLMALCLGLRFMVPIWGPYLRIAQTAVGVNLKEYFAFNLIKSSKIYKARAISRMEEYISANIDDGDVSMASLLHFLSDAELPMFSLAMTVIRKLSIAPISFDHDKFHLMKILYSFATSKVKRLSMVLEPGLKDKSSYGMFEDDNSSVFCVYRMKEQISTGDMVVFETYIENYVRAALSVDPTIDPKMVEQCVQMALSAPKWKITNIQKGLISWTLSPVIVGSVINMLKRKYLLITAGITQALLWHWGLYELAVLTTAKPKRTDATEYKVKSGKMKISDETLAIFDKMFPYKLPLHREIPGGWSDNSGVRGVELYHQELSLTDWWVQCPKELAKEVDDSHVTGYIETSSELRETLAKLLITIYAVKA